MAFARVQSSLGIHGFQVPGAITLGSTPTVGNLLIACISVNETSWTVGTGWTQFDTVQYEETNSPTVTIMLYRYVQSGDTATLPAFMSAGTTWWAHEVYELSGASGVWAQDFLWGSSLVDAVSTQALPQKKAYVNGSLGLLFSSAYNGNSNPSVTGSWTMDDTANNNSNYGSTSGSHRAMNAGDAIDGTLTQTNTSGPIGAYVMILTPAQPAIERVRRGFSLTNPSVSTPGAITLPFVPEQGGLILVGLGWNDGSSATPTIGGSWTELASASGGTGKMLMLLGRYVQPGDTATMPTLVTSGSDYWTLSVVELAGVQGTFAVDNNSNKSGFEASGSPFTTTADGTNVDDELALLFFLSQGFGYSTTTGFGFYQKTDFGTIPNRRSWFCAVKESAAPGTTIQGAITPAAGGGNPQAYIQALFGGTTPQNVYQPRSSPKLIKRKAKMQRRVMHRGGGAAVASAVAVVSRRPFVWVD